MTVCIHLTIPLPFIDEELAMYFQSLFMDFFDDAPGARKVIMVTATEEELAIALSAYPQINILEKHQPNGYRAGLIVTYDIEGLPIVNGNINYTPDTATLSSVVKGGRNLVDDDTLRLAGWAKRDFS